MLLQGQVPEFLNHLAYCTQCKAVVVVGSSQVGVVNLASVKYSPRLLLHFPSFRKHKNGSGLYAMQDQILCKLSHFKVNSL